MPKLTQALATVAVTALRALAESAPPGLVKKIDDLCNEITAQFGGGGGPG